MPDTVIISTNDSVIEVGTAGPQGPAGAAAPDGGTTGQVLAKASDDNQDVEWIDPGAPTSRTITAGDGLTGGGDLTADRTIDVDFGNTSGTVCEGDDARLSDARTPTAHNQAWSTITDTPTTVDGYGIKDDINHHASWWAGDWRLFGRILENIDQYCRLIMIGDSISAAGYASGGGSPTGLGYGIAVSWPVPAWAGICCPSTMQGDGWLFSTLHTATSGGSSPQYRTPFQTKSAGTAVGDLPDGIVPMGCTVNAPTADIDNNGCLAQLYIQAHTLNRFVSDPDWFDAPNALTARLVYIGHPNAHNLKVLAQRTMFNNTRTFLNPLNTVKGTPQIAYEDMSLGTAIGSTSACGALIYNPDSEDETGKSCPIVMLRIFRDAKDGFELCIAGVGASTLEDHLDDDFYDSTACEQLLAATESNTFRIQLGQNLSSAMATELGTNGNNATFKAAYEALVDKWRAAALAAGVVDPVFLLVNNYKTAYTEEVMQLRWDALVEIANSRTDCVAINQYTLCGDTAADLDDGIHPLPAGSARFMLVEWNAMVRAYAEGAARAVPATRLIQSGDGLSGGGSLEDDITLAADFSDARYSVPVGTVVDFTAASIPDGWLLCDGQAVSRSGYSELFTAIGTSYGAGNGTTTFNVPDLRQKYTMGVAASGTGNSLGATFGAIDHTHSVDLPSANTSTHNPTVEVDAIPASGGAFAAGSHSHTYNPAAAASTSNNPPTMALHKIIKARKLT